jgi:tetratricopeptide (TPR) repeat protein
LRKGLWLLLALVPATAAAEPAAGPTGAPASPRSAAADAATYERCMALARRDPVAAQKLAEDWHRRGGAHPADHCFAVALIGLKRYPEAAARLEALARAMVKAPAALRADVLDQAGQAWILAGQPVRAYAAIGEALSLAPNDPSLLVDRAEAAGLAGQYENAISDLDRVLAADPKRADALLYRAAAYRALKRLDPALADADKAVRLAPNSAPALLERGNIRGLKGDLAGARADWLRVRELAAGSKLADEAAANLARLGGKPEAGRH